MSGTNDLLDAFNFSEAADAEGLDINAIFGGSGAVSNVNPFDTLQVTPAQNTPEPPSSAVTQTSVIPEAQTTSTPHATVSPKRLEDTTTDNLIQEAFQRQEDENTRKGLFDKLPLFSYGSAKEAIEDPFITFEELRIAKAEDFPELAEGKKVSWTVEYGKSVKAITDPKGTTISSIKEEIERSKSFLDSLKKSKDKTPNCLVKPKVIAQSKGIASYKGVFTTMEEARASDKIICLIPSQNGRVYELRKTEAGEFIAPKQNISEFSSIRAGFNPALPKIPRGLMLQIIAFFRYFVGRNSEYEALVHIYWDKEENAFVLHVPHQQVCKAYLRADLQTDALPEGRYLHYADVHSHNSMEAKFSHTDDRDELATRLYIVVGHLDHYFPTVVARMSCGGTFFNIDLSLIAEPIEETFPPEWLERVELCNTRKNLAPGNAYDNIPAQIFHDKGSVALSLTPEELGRFDKSFRYQLLDRLCRDCEYYLGYGKRQIECLWEQSEKSHIALMKLLWLSFSEEDQPVWLSYEDIQQYEVELLSGGRQA